MNLKTLFPILNGIRLAVFNNIISSDDVWNDHWKKVETQWVEDNGELLNKMVRVPHASNPIHIEHLIGWISRRLEYGFHTRWQKRTFLGAP